MFKKKVDPKSQQHKPAVLSNGPGTHEIPLELFALNRSRLIERIQSKKLPKSIVLLQGGKEMPMYDTDVPYGPFRQESFFRWAFGVIEAGCYGAIDVYAEVAHLFIPRYTKNYDIWKGPMFSPEEFSRKYGIPQVHSTDEIATVLRNMNCSVLLTLKGINSDSNLPSFEARFPGIEKFQVNNSVLYNEMSDLRVYKTDFEIEVMKYVIDISSEAHRVVMQYARPGRTEYQCEAEFREYCYAMGGCQNMSHPAIVAADNNSAYLEYAPTSQMLEPGNMCLCDLGASYFGYSAAITCAFPANGKFTAPQKTIYEAVLAANQAVYKQMKPGTNWLDMHLLAHRVLLNELKKGGLLKGDVDQMVDSGLGAVFQPHGLGHLLGLDIRDVGGFIGAKRSNRKECEALRTTRDLQERMVLALQPGCYFIDSLLDEALANPALLRFLNPDAIKKYRGFGGIRIGDDILITEDGAVNLTKVPRTVKEIEQWIAGRVGGVTAPARNDRLRK